MTDPKTKPWLYRAERLVRRFEHDYLGGPLYAADGHQLEGIAMAFENRLAVEFASIRREALCEIRDAVASCMIHEDRALVSQWLRPGMYPVTNDGP